MSKPILKAFLKKRSIDKSVYVTSSNFQKRWFVLDDDNLTYYDGKISKMGEEKGKIELKKILAVEALDQGSLDGKMNVFQVIHICATRYDPVILYVVTGSTEEQEKWISGIRKCAIKNNATFIKNYHSGVWTGACFTCCHAQGKLARGCKVVHGCVEGEDQGKQTSSGISSSSSSIKSRTRTAPSRPPPSIPHNNGESSGARHTEHDSPRSSAKSRLTKKSSSTSQSSSNGRSQINKICVGIYDYSPSSDSDVTIVKGERFEVLDDSDENWWTVKNIKNGESGYAPKNYLEEDAAVDAYDRETKCMDMMRKSSSFTIAKFMAPETEVLEKE